MIKFENIINKNLLMEFDFSDIINWIENTWIKLNKVIVDIFNDKVTDLEPGEETIITIPTSVLTEGGGGGAISAIKGNLNEAMTCYFIIKKNFSNKILNDTVKLSPKYNNEHEHTIKRYNSLKKQFDSLKDSNQKNVAELAVKNGSMSIATHIVEQTKFKNSVIQGAWVDNLGAITDVSNKGDIKIALRKIGLTKSDIDSYSLKLYSTVEVGLDNSSPRAFVEKLTSKDSESALQYQQIISSGKYNDIRTTLSFVTGYYNFYKEIIKKIDEGTDPQKVIKYINSSKKVTVGVKKRTILNLKNKQVLLSLKEKWFTKRAEARNLADPVFIKACYITLKKFISTDNGKNIFVKNLLKILGYEDHETKILMALMNKKGELRRIIDKKPELDLSPIDLRYDGGVQIFIVNGNRKMAILSGKEGGATGRISVNFKDV